MKFVLTLWLCSFLSNECTTAIKSPLAYNTWKECVEDAYKTSILILADQDNNNVEEFRLATKFMCKEDNVI